MGVVLSVFAVSVSLFVPKTISIVVKTKQGSRPVGEHWFGLTDTTLCH